MIANKVSIFDNAAFVLSLVLTLALGEVSGATEKPFWVRNKKLYSKVRDQRLIATSVKSQKSVDLKKKSGLQRLSMQGIGHIRVPAGFAYKQVTDYKTLKEMSSHILESKFKSTTQTLFLHTQALGYHARMWIKMNAQAPLNHSSPELSKIKFQVLRGVFAGFSGELSLRELSSQSSEIILNGSYFYNKAPIPQVFLDFGLEMVLQKMAARMRGHIEERYKKRKP